MLNFVQNKPFIVKDTNVYNKISGELYGSYSNSRVKRISKQSDIIV